MEILITKECDFWEDRFEDDEEDQPVISDQLYEPWFNSYGFFYTLDEHQYLKAAHIARRKSLRFSKLYKRVSLRKGPQVAIGAVARELAVVSFYVLKYQKAFKDYKW